MSAETLGTSVGARLWYEGAAWTVVQLDGSAVLLRSADRFMRVHAPALVGESARVLCRYFAGSGSRLRAS